MTTITAPALAPAPTQEGFALSITRRVYAIDCMTGAKLRYFVRNYRIVG